MRPNAESKLRQRTTALGVTLLLHLLILCLLYWLRLEDKGQSQPVVEELLLVNLGDVPSATGDEEPEGKQEDEPDVTGSMSVVSQPTRIEASTPPNPPAPAPKSTSTPPPALPTNKTTTTKPLQTQRVEPSIPAPQKQKETRKEAEHRVQEERHRAQEEQKARDAAEKLRAEAEAHQAERRRQIGQSVAGAFGGKASTSTSQGTGNSGSGNEGNPKGSLDGHDLKGSHIISNGGYPTRPHISKAIRGTIRIRIAVAPSGQVTEASVEPRGTDIAEAAIRSASIAAARATTFNPIEGSSERRGTITYHFVQ